jgi:hypothetical protein
MDKVTIYRVLWSTLKLDATNRHGLADVITLEDHRRALDAERERLKGQIDYSIQLQQLIESLRRDDTPSPELYHHKIIVEFKRQLATLQAQLADRDAMILQMGEQAAVLAKENMAVKAQLRQVEGQSQQQAEEAVIVFAKYTTLRQLVEALPVLDMRFDSVAVGPLGWTVGGVTFGKVTEANAYSALLQYRATLAARKEPKHE